MTQTQRTRRLNPPARYLSASEFADAGVLAAASVLLITVGKLIPHLGAIEAAGVLPFVVLGARRRVRAVVAAAVAAAAVAALLTGVGGILSVLAAAVLGGGVGRLTARGWSLPAVVGLAALPGLLLGAAVTALLAVLTTTRTLLLGAAAGSIDGTVRILATIPGLQQPVGSAGSVLHALLDLWWLLLPLGATGVTTTAAGVLRMLTPKLLARLALPVDDPISEIVHLEHPVAPIPATLRNVRVHFTDAAQPALHDLNLTVQAGQLTVITGGNGSGKSTLLRSIAGAAATAGQIERPGGVGLGEPGGTALLLQRPETQVLGSTVGEDLRWALPAISDREIQAALLDVGLALTPDSSTAGLSGGQLQRLAIAGALLQHPTLILSDESTAMVDPAGRRALIGLLHRAARHGAAVVHVTHFHDEVRSADRHLVLAEGHLTRDAPPASTPHPSRASAHAAPLPGPGAELVLELADVSYTYAAGTPWEHTAFTHLDLTIHRGEAIRIIGDNGAGKSTLARLLAGLITPRDGSRTVHPNPGTDIPATVGLAFQLPRLQLLRPTVQADIAAAAGQPRADHRTARRIAVEALHTVGLDPALADRHVETLSGGQMRRVALAGVLASRPALLVLDEPFAGLDPDSAQTLTATLARLRDEGLAIVTITHDTRTGDHLHHRTLQLHDGQLT